MPAPTGVVPLRGSAYAELVIPRIDLDMIVVQGTDTESLKKGPGHYPDTADPWDDTGRVGIAGHRTTYLAPFNHLDAMRVGDPITLRTEYGTFDYRVTEEVSAALIEKLTDALCEAVHPGLRDHTWVIVEGHDPKNWGLGGKPWPVGEMPPGP